MAAPAPPEAEPTRGFPGSRFVLLAVLAMALLVTFILVGSPVLLERTLERVPPQAPHTVESGAAWEATATQADEDTACLELAIDGRTSTDCTGVRGLPLRVLDARPVDAGGHVVYGIVDPRTTRVDLELDDGGPVVLDVVHVDFGFPLGFFATELRPDTDVQRVIGREDDGTARSEAACPGPVPSAERCEIQDLR